LRIFFDLDGPILDVSRRYFRVHSEVVREIGGTPGEENAFWEAKRARRSAGEILEAEGNGALDLGRYQRLWLERIEGAEFLESDRLQRGVVETLEALRSEHKLTVVTLRQRPELVNAQLAQFKLKHFFDRVLIGSPLETAGWETKSRLITSVTPAASGSWIIGDTEVDIRAGKALGMVTVGVLSGIRERKSLEGEKPDFIVGGISDVREIISRA
jgi:phosphoglycolate phosphatase-like HAD superfamily hydrolase